MISIKFFSEHFDCRKPGNPLSKNKRTNLSSAGFSGRIENLALFLKLHLALRWHLKVSSAGFSGRKKIGTHSKIIYSDQVDSGGLIIEFSQDRDARYPWYFPWIPNINKYGGFS